MYSTRTPRLATGSISSTCASAGSSSFVKAIPLTRTSTSTTRSTRMQCFPKRQLTPASTAEPGENLLASFKDEFSNSECVGISEMPENLEQLITSSGGPVKLLRNSQTGPYVYPVVPPEYTNWRDEQHAWQHACVLFNQSYHMTDMYVEGPGALKLFSDLGVNSFKNFDINKGKQFVVCNYDGYVIGDVI